MPHLVRSLDRSDTGRPTHNQTTRRIATEIPNKGVGVGHTDAGWQHCLTELPCQWIGGNLKSRNRNRASPQAWPSVIRVGCHAEDDSVGPYRSGAGSSYPTAPFRNDGVNFRFCVDGRTTVLNRLCETESVVQRVNATTAPIEPAAGVERGASEFCHIGARELS